MSYRDKFCAADERIIATLKAEPDSTWDRDLLASWLECGGPGSMGAPTSQSALDHGQTTLTPVESRALLGAQ